MSEYDDSSAPVAESGGEDELLDARSESAESAESGPTDLASAARLLGAEEG